MQFYAVISKCIGYVPTHPPYCDFPDMLTGHDKRRDSSQDKGTLFHICLFFMMHFLGWYPYVFFCGQAESKKEKKNCLYSDSSINCMVQAPTLLGYMLIYKLWC